MTYEQLDFIADSYIPILLLVTMIGFIRYAQHLLRRAMLTLEVGRRN